MKDDNKNVHKVNKNISSMKIYMTMETTFFMKKGYSV
jgi:hypothetical protein